MPDAFQGCVNTNTGVLRIIAAGQSCQSHETAITLGSSGGDAKLLARIEALEEDNAGQQATIDALVQRNADRLQEITELQGELAALESAHADLQAQVPDCLSNRETEVYFTGCNVNIRSGSGSTNGEVNGLGNLIVGYNEALFGELHTGSHNVVIGRAHTFTSFGGLVVGLGNTISGEFSSVSGGALNTASGDESSVSGGADNTASGPQSSISGGLLNTASDSYSSISGGGENTASGLVSSVGGGQFNVASGFHSTVAGGVSYVANQTGEFKP